MRVIKYKTVLDECRKLAVLEKVVSVNYRDMENDFSTPSKVVWFTKDFLKLDREAEEYMYVLCLNNKNRMTCLFELSHGSISQTTICIRELFQKVLLANSSRFILIHNHPSGDSYPSHDDLTITMKIEEGGLLLQVPLVDHVIVGVDYYSFKENGDI